MYHIPRTFTRAYYPPVRGYRYLPNLGPDLSIYETINDELLFLQTTDYDYISMVPRTITTDCFDDILELTHAIDYVKSHAWSETITHFLGVQQNCIKYSFVYFAQTISRTINHSLNFSQNLTGTTGDIIVESITHTLTFTEDIQHIIPDEIVTHNLDFEQIIQYTLNGLTIIDQSDTIIFNQTIVYSTGTVSNIYMNHELMLTEEIMKIRSIEQSINHSLTLTTSLSNLRFIEHRIRQNLILESLPQINGIYSLFVDHTLSLLENIPRTFSHTEIIQIPSVLGVIIPRGLPFVKLQAEGHVIVLPAPKFTDSESTIGQLKVKRSMTGGSKVYVRRSELRTLQYTFSLTRNKAMDFQSFIMNNHSQLIHLTNWKGENWFGYLLTNPTTFTERRMYDNEISIEFEGIQVS